MQEFENDQFDLVYFDVPYFESNSFRKNDIQIPYQSITEYIEYLARIIIHLRHALKDNGSLLLRVNPLSPFNARLFLDRVFGKQNLRAEIIWERKATGLRSTSTPYANFESVFFYSKTDRFVYHLPTRALTHDEIKRVYHYEDEKGLYGLLPLIDNLSRPKGSFEWKGFTPPKGKSWRYSEDRLNALYQEGNIEFSKKTPQRKNYLEGAREIPLGFVWTDTPVFNLKGGPYDPRLQRAIELASDSSANILCLFSDLASLNTIQKSNLESAANRQWVSITPFDPAINLLKEFQKEESRWINYLRDSGINVQVNILDMQEDRKRELPSHIQKLVLAESQSLDASTLSATTGQKYAFLVGINQYESGIRELNYCVNDAIKLGATLQKHGYQVRILHTEVEDSNLFPRRSSIIDELAAWTQNLLPEDTLYVHFSCHGDLIGEESVLIVSDTRHRSISKTALKLNDVIETMKSGRARKLVLSLDVCHGGVDMGRALIDKAFMQNVYENAEGFVVLAASTAHQKAYEVHEYQHGLFTYFLIKGLSGDADADENGVISVEDIRNYVLHQISQWNMQNHKRQEPTYRAEGIGEIILVNSSMTHSNL
ncbi:MAG TPA: caspase family protein [Anaerolineales bacterium]|nr:caspase family protein [Anaerolineales bacterium]HNO93812.1 caspase family protein [Anaerolineales bacterium]